MQTVPGRTINSGRLTDVSLPVGRFAPAGLGVVEAAPGSCPWWPARLVTGFAGGNAALVFEGGWGIMLAAGDLDRQPPQGEQVQVRHQPERHDLQGVRLLLLGAVVCWRWERGRGDTRDRDYTPASSARGRAAPGGQRTLEASPGASYKCSHGRYPRPAIHSSYVTLPMTVPRLDSCCRCRDHGHS
jgi:hypothetical protein